MTGDTGDECAFFHSWEKLGLLGLSDDAGAAVNLGAQAVDQLSPMLVQDDHLGNIAGMAVAALAEDGVVTRGAGLADEQL